MLANERGFGFNTLPMVIDPVASALEVELFRFEGGADAAPSARWEVFHRVAVPEPFLPASRTFAGANCYANRADYRDADIILAYAADGVISGVFYRHAGDWRLEAFPEEMTGAPPRYASLRFVFDDRDAMADALGRVLRLRRAEAAGVGYQGMDDDAAGLVVALLRCPEGPRVIEVADPAASANFGTTTEYAGG